MERNTVLAVVLSAIVITVGFTIQAVFFAPEPVDPPPAQPVETDVIQRDHAEDADTDAVRPAYRPGSAAHFELIPLGEDPSRREVTIKNGVFDAVFSNAGAMLRSLKLVEHLDDGAPVEAVFTGTQEQGAFYLYLGEQFTQPIRDTFHIRQIDSLTVEFYRDFSFRGSDGEVHPDHFTITKRFAFKPNDYLFEVSVNIRNSVRQAPPLDFEGFAYTMGFEPQIGPKFEALDNRYEYRRFYTYAGGKKDNVRLRNGIFTTDDFLVWTSLAGKYFTVIGIPDSTRYRTTLIEGEEPGIPQTSKIMYSRPALRSSETTDVFRFYIGPQQMRTLSAYNRTTDNEWGIRDLNLEEAMDASTWFGWLENILKFFLDLFYRLIPNYGVAIILLTILIKVVLYPLTKKSLDSTAKMQTLNPKIQEIKEKYKGNTQKMNQAMAELYKQEKINPLGMGCLPMLLQFPIFIALYGLLNKHFELRGAVFIPGWITDLSAPDSILSFAPFTIPLLNVSDIRLLPIIYLATMILSFKMTQATSAGATQANMKFMTLGMPIILFFVLYNAPSGLLLYWTVMNVFTMLQQKFVNQRKMHKVEEEKKAAPKFAVVQGGKKKTDGRKPKQIKGPGKKK